MNNLKKRCLTLLLSLAMIVTYMPTSMIAYAVDNPDQTEVEATAPEAEETSDDTVSEDTVVEDVASEEVTSPEEQSSEDVDEPVDEPAEEPKEDVKTEAEGEAKDEFSDGFLTAEEGPYEVVVSYSEKAEIPKGAKLKLTMFDENDREYEEAKEALVSDEEGNSAFSQTTEEEQEGLGMAAFDLTIYDKDGNIVEPNDEVSVSFKLKELPEGVDAEALASSMEIQHLNESSGDVVVEKIATVDSQEAKKDDALGEIAVNETKETAEVETVVNGFSTYTVTWRSGGRTVTVHYVDENGNELTIKNPSNTHQNINANSSSPAFLVYDIEGYEYSYTYLNNTNTRIVPMLSKNSNNRWRSRGTGSYADWSEMNNNDDVYVVYKTKTAPSDAGIPVIDPTQEEWPSGEDELPYFSKNSKSNNNGTNTIALSIKAAEKAVENNTKANVLVVFDVSGSMSWDMDGDNPGYYEDSRLEIAQDAVNAMAHTLLNKKDKNGNNLVKMALISFSTTAKLEQGFTSNEKTFTDKVNDLSAGGGTNWEEALALANRTANADSDAATYIVFVSDGDPTFRKTRGDFSNNDLDVSPVDNNYSYSTYRDNQIFGMGNSSGDNAQYTVRNYNPAVTEATSIVNKNKNLYAIGVSNDVTLMEGLVEDSGAGGSHYYSGSDADAVATAFESIANAINSDLGFGDVQINDGITDLTNTSMEVFHRVDENSFKYYRYGGENNKYGIDEANKTEWTTREQDGCGPASYNEQTGTVEWNMGSDFQLEDGVTYIVEFRVWPSQEAYDLVADLNNGVKVYEAGHANSITAEQRNQVVELDTNPVTYALKTNTDEVNATYKKTTKTGETVTVSDNNPIEAVYHPGSIANLGLESELLTVQKTFEDDLTGASDRQDEVVLKLKRRVTGEGEYADYPNASASSIVLNEDNNWKFQMYVAPGLKVDDEILEKGYQFTITEPGIDYHYDLIEEVINPMVVDGNIQWIGDADGDTSLTAINRVKSGIDIRKVVKDASGNEIFPDTEFTITGKLLGPDGQPYTWSEGDSVDASGAYHKFDKDGNRIIYKGHFADSSNIEFTLKAGEYVRFINVPEGCTFEYTEVATDGFELDNIEAKTQHIGSDGEFTPAGDVQPEASKATSTAKLETGVVGNKQYSVTYTNKPSEMVGAKVVKTFSGINKDDIPAGFAINAKSSTVDETLTTANAKEVSQDGLTFTWELSGLVIGDKLTVAESGETSPAYDLVDKTIDPASGEITISKTATENVVTLSNVYERYTTSIKVNKVWEDNNNQDGKRDSVTLLVLDGTNVVASIVLNATDHADPQNANKWSATINNLPRYTAQGEEITYRIAEQVSKEVSDAYKSSGGNWTVDGNTATDEGKTTVTNGEATVTNTHTPEKKEIEVTKIWDDASNQDGKRPASVKFTVSGSDGKTYEATLSGTGNTWTKKVSVDKYYNDNGTGKEVTFTVDEDAVADYQKTIDNSKLTITNKYSPKTSDFVVEKIWVDSNNANKTRPEKVVFALFKTPAGGTIAPVMNGDKQVTGELSETTQWKYTFQNLPDYEGGKKLTYSVKEMDGNKVLDPATDKLTGLKGASYTVEYTDNDTITNTLATVETDKPIQVKKVLTGRDWKEGDSFKFTLTAVTDNAPMPEKTEVTIDKDTPDYTAAFGKILYDHADTYTYEIKEVKPDLAIEGVEYDETDHTVEVKVEKQTDGTLKATIKYDGNTADFATVTNDYKASGTADLEVSKKLNGRTLEDKQFTFQLKDKDGKVLKTAQNDASGKVAFESLSYNQDDIGKTYNYTITEVNDNAQGYTYDSHEVRASVKVEDNGDGTLKTTVSYSNDTEFINTYKANGSATIEVTKKLEGRDLEANQFIFQLKDKDGTTLQSAKNDAEGKVKFEPISYNQDDVGKSYTYKITEVNAGAAGYTYDDLEVTATVTIEDNGNGTLKTTVTYSNDKEFNNSYGANGKADLKVTKKLTGRDLADQQFTFELKDSEGTTLQSAKNDANGNVAFDSIKYTQADVGKTFTYTITEVNDGASGYKYDDLVVTATVTVSDNGNGTLKVDVEYSKDTEFNNEYTADGEAKLEASKKLEGRTLANEQFSFELKDKDGTVLETVKNDAEGKVTFAPINYTQKDVGKTFTYTITEVKAGAQGYTYDEHTLTANVEVKDNGDGTLKTTVTYSGNQEFTNYYNAAGKADLEVSKKLKGRKLEDKQFSFVLKDSEGETIETVTNDENGKVAFSTINYTEADAGKTFTYKITEVNAGAAGYSYDDLEVTATVKVEDNGDGTLKTTVTYSEDTEFNNTYVASGETQFAVSKKLEGRTLANEQFTFELKDESGKVLQTKKNDANGAVTFDKIKYDEADAGKTFIYTVTEVKGNAPGYTYDEHAVTYTVTVKDNGDGNLVATYTTDGALEFKNTYEAKGKADLKVTKKLAGRTLENEQFSFELKDKDGNVLQTVKNDAAGNVAFASINYTEADAGQTYTYTITEINDKAKGYTYDGLEVTATVKIEDNGDGTLKTTVTYSEDTEFNNKYDANGKADLEVTKKLEGRKLENEQFSFELKDKAGTVLQTVKNDANGKVAFASINYTQADVGKTFTYTITEVNDKAKGYTYDGLEVTATVKVEDNGDGTLKTTVTYSDDTEFNNTYKATGKANVEVTKALAGRTLENEQFSFELKDKDGNVLQTAKNDADGKVAFAAINYTEADAGKTYTYKITEVNDKAKGYAYDGLEVTATVKVEDNGDGTLKTTVTYSDDTEFNNTYDATGNAVIEVTKKLTGRELADKQFVFELRDKDGTVLQTVKNDAEGKVTFAPINYTEEDVSKTFTYTVKEVDAGAVGYTYDELEVTATVSVADNGDGTLKTTVKYSNDTEFNNTYEASGDASFEVTKKLEGRELADKQFTFELKDSEGTVLQTVTNNAKGIVSFAPISYTQDDAGKTFTYKITEVNAGAKGYTYDDLEVTVTVKVEDNGNGTLKATVTYSRDTEFNNTYKASGKADLEVTKKLAGRDLADKQFSFELKDNEGTVLQTVKNDAKGKVAFESLNYTEADVDKTFTYTITEVNAGAAGYAYDNLEVTARVKVEDNGDGTLKTTVTYSDDTEFNNTYAASGKTSFEVTKKLAGRKLADGQFTFQLLDEKGEVLQTKTNNAAGKVAFDEIEYLIEGARNDLGTHKYKIKEINAEAESYTYDTLEVDVTVEVTDNGNGTLKASVKYSDDKEFNNTYVASGDVQFIVNKELNGRTVDKDQFTFELKDETGKVLQTKKNDENGVVTFDKIEYDQDDVDSSPFKYTISEVNDEAKGYTYDDHVVEVTVTVTDDGKGHLKAEPTFKGSLKFENTYEAAGKTTLSAKKTLNGRELEAGEFTFELRDSQNKVVDTAKNAADGTVTFKELAYTEADVDPSTHQGEVKYTISEVNEGKTCFGYDSHNETITVSLKDNGDGTITATPDKTGAKVEFINTYEANGDVTFEGKKTIEGRKMTDKDVFTFEIKEGDTVVGTATSDGTGKITYPTITYKVDADHPTDDLGEHTYIVKETSKDGNGITVATNTYEVKVNVTDNGDGTLTATPSDNYKALDFVNNYEATGTVDFNAFKKLRNGDLTEQTFDVELVQVEKKFIILEDEETLQTKTVGGEGATVSGKDSTAKVDFDTITFTKNAEKDETGEYTYIVREVVPADAVNGDGVTYEKATAAQKAKGGFDKDGVRYDSHEQRIKVTVTDDGKGNLIVVKDPAVAEGDYDIELLNAIPTPPEKTVFKGGTTTVIDGKMVKPGDDLTYQITYTNTTGEDVTATIVDSIPAHTFYKEGTATEGGKYRNGKITWELPVGDGNSVTVQFTVTVEDDVTGETITNESTVDDGKNNYTSNEVGNPTPPKKEVFKGSSTTNVDGKQVKEGDEITYKITYTNTSGKDMKVDIVDELPQNCTYVDGSASDDGVFADGKVTWTDVDAKNGETIFVTFKVTVNKNSGVALDNKAYVDDYESNVTHNPTPTDPVKTEFSGTSTTNIDGKPVSAGEKLTYKINYKNTTGETAKKVTITDTIPAHTTYVEGSATEDGDYSNGVITWTFENVADGDEIEVEFAVTVDNDKEAVLTNTATVRDGVNDLDSNEVFNTKPVKDVIESPESTTSIDGKTVKPNDVLTYSISYTNPDKKNAQTVQIADEIPQYTTYKKDSASTVNGVKGELVNGAVTWADVKVEAGATVTVTFQVTVNDTVSGQAIDNDATVKVGENTYTTNGVSNPTPPKKEIYTGTSTTNIDGQRVEPGQELTYSITYTNPKDETVEATITDTIPAHTTLVKDSISEGGELSGKQITWKKSVDAGKPVTVSFKVKVDEDVSGQILTNESTVKYGDNEYTSNEVSNPTPPKKEVFTGSSKTNIDGKDVEPGDELTYQITFVNDKVVDGKAVDVEANIRDEIPAHTTYVPDSADNDGVYADGAITWKKTVEAGKSLTVSFKVKVDGNAAGEELRNEAVYKEGENGKEIKTNEVVNPVTKELEIRKSLASYLDHGKFVQAAFSFRVTGTYEETAEDGTKTTKNFNTIVGLDFNSESDIEQTKLLTGLPSTLKDVQVEEIYSGNYDPDKTGPVSITEDGGTFKVEFSNKFTDDYEPKGGVTNKYVRGDNGYKYQGESTAGGQGN